MGDGTGRSVWVSDPLFEARRRILGLVSIAAAHGGSVSVEELSLLLPEPLFSSLKDLERFIQADKTLQGELVVSAGEVAPKGKEGLIVNRAAQRDLTSERRVMAQAFALRMIALCPWVCVVGLSGSMAYDGSKPQDDIDFFMVVGRRRLWITLLLALFAARVLRQRNGGSPIFCFNRVVDLETCRETFRTLRDPMFAREALNVKVLMGEHHYRDLLTEARWMGEYFPRLYWLRCTSRSGSQPPSAPLRGPQWNLLNLAALLSLGPYLWLIGLVRNRRLRKKGNHASEFRTVIHPGFFALEARKYDALREEYRRCFENGVGLR